MPYGYRSLVGSAEVIHKRCQNMNKEESALEVRSIRDQQSDKRGEKV